MNDLRLETLGNLKAHYPQIAEIIGQNAAGELVSTELMDVPIVGGQAFVVFSEVSVQLDLTGTPWTQNEQSGGGLQLEKRFNTVFSTQTFLFTLSANRKERQ